MTEVGDRVGALRCPNPPAVELLGFGVYEGRQLIPHWHRKARSSLPTQRALIARKATKPLSYWLLWHTALNEVTRHAQPSAVRTDEQVRAVAEASLQRAQERANWTDEQIIADMKTTPLLTDARIRLDDGSVVWGTECWWGPEAFVQHRLDALKAHGAKITTVTLPADRFGPPDDDQDTEGTEGATTTDAQAPGPTNRP